MVRPVGRRQEIHETFIRHVANHGYDHTKFSAIGDELGISTGTIVYHFGSKAQMLRELEETYMEWLLGINKGMWNRLELPEERIAATIYSAVLIHATARDATVAFSREVTQVVNDPGMEPVRTKRRELQRMTRQEVQRGANLGRFRPVDVIVAVQHLWSVSQWLWIWFNPNGTQTPEEVGAAVVDVFLGGLLVDRLGLAKLADPRGHVATVVREIVTDDQTGSRR